jgi:hypothetical protein
MRKFEAEKDDEWDERYKNIANGTNKSGGWLTTDFRTERTDRAGQAIARACALKKRGSGMRSRWFQAGKKDPSRHRRAAGKGTAAY